MESRQHGTAATELRQRFGRHIKCLRSGLGPRGLSQEAFAERCGLSKPYISAIERGIANPKLTHLACLAKGLGISLPELMHWEHYDLSNPDELRGILRHGVDNLSDQTCRELLFTFTRSVHAERKKPVHRSRM